MGQEEQGQRKPAETQALWVRILLRTLNYVISSSSGSLHINIVDKNDNAPYFLPDHQTFGE